MLKSKKIIPTDPSWIKYSNVYRCIILLEISYIPYSRKLPVQHRYRYRVPYYTGS